MRKVAIYSRVSTINQAEEGYSIQGQIEALTKYCEAMEWKIYKNYSDAGFSGGKLERPAITELIEDGKNNMLLMFFINFNTIKNILKK